MSTDVGVVSTQREVRAAMRRSTDPRSQRTRAAIIGAVHDLAREDTGSVPSVSEIIRRAGVSRSSFYTQFSDVGALVQEVLRDALERIRLDDSDLRRARSVSEAQATQIAAEHVVDHVIEHRGFYRLGLATGGAALWESINVVAEQLAASDCVRHGPDAGVSIEMASAFLAGGLLTLLHAVVSGQVEADPAEVTDQFLAMLPAWLFGEDRVEAAAGRA